MGWTCQHDEKGFCKLLKVPCQPGIKGCTINKGAEVVFTTGSYEEDKKRLDGSQEEIDFAALARSN
ncbi:MAG: hypothetical protein PHW18_08790 [Sulfuricurvum sp.]|uniref:hypothetical protein n=1 Tax=Sulfuricurvum sp. TaxID=2025608 RepID=UPI0026177A70|nr:hypothetical protein [Sulfuricurvum sp.]MDD2829654.1 hypothetical protein [Sulfuricurvum sp.]MDD4948678.1 hypothetical protein [Sulfuricurvum sp.]